MRYEDTSGSVSGSATPGAHDDADTLATGSNGPAVGNVITGAGTTTGKAGADSPADGHVVAVRGASGTDASDSGTSLHVDGRFGTLAIDEHGNYKYVADGHAPQNFRDLFQYTLADSKGGRSVADLVISRGGEIQVSENAQKIVPNPDGTVTLPAGVDLNDVHVVGRDLIVTMPDGSQIVIVDGAVFVPQLVLGGVEVPSTNLAALLIDAEPKPAAGNPQSSGGNFDVPVPPLDPGVPLGDLIPPTELHFTPPEFHEVNGIIDKKPEAGTAAVQLDDDALAGGNAGGVGDDPDSVGTPGFLPGSGGDGALTWGLSTAGAPSGFTYVDGPNGSILVQQVQDGNTVTVLTVTVDPTDGSYTVTQNHAIMHPAGGDENNVSLTINYTVTDSDGDVAAGTLNINVDDDTPTVSVTAGSDSEVSLTTHDALTPGAGSEAVSTTADFSGVFGGTSSSPGADGAGAGTTSGYALTTTGGASGLFSHGVAINLYNVGGVIVGSTSTTAPATATDASVVFSVSTTNTGIVTLTQYQQIDHTADPHPTGAPFTDDIMSLTDGAITLTRSLTVVDKDGDSVTGSASVQIGANLHFVDDGPTIGIADRGEPNLTVDETDLSINASASFAANFSANFGADGPAASGSITYALGINAGATGLVDVATGQAIVLVNNAGVVEGHVGNAAGALAFTVSVDSSGVVTLDQTRALAHPDATNPDDSVGLANDNLVTLTATAHDFDGDTASSTLNIGSNLHFEDDGPSISASSNQPSLTVDETNLAVNATASFASVFTPVFGADGAGTVTYALGMNAGSTGLVDVATGQAIVLVNNAGVIEGHVGNAAGAIAFTVSVDGSGNVTLDQVRALSHPDASNPNDSVSLANDNLVTLTATVTDKDGDQDSATANIGQNLNFLDDGPAISLSGSEGSLTVDETNLAVNATGSFAAAFTPVFGADGAGSVSYALTISAPGANSGLVDVATGSAIVLVNNAGVIEGHVGTTGGALAFTVSVDGSGNVTLDQIRAVSHPDGSNPNDSVTLSADNLIGLTATVTDKDGDHSSATLNIGQNLNFLDDGPSISASTQQPSLTVDETNLAINASASFAGVFTTSFGADGAGTIAYSLGISAPGANSGLIDVATGSAIVLVNNAGVIEGHVGTTGGALAFTVTVDGSGNVTLDQIRAVQHPDGSNPNDSVTLSSDSLVTLTATITDRDGDHQSATANIGQNLNFLDDGPSISLANVAEPNLSVDETVLATNDTKSFAGAFNSSFGADGAGNVTYSLSVLSAGVSSGLVDTATGQSIVLVNNAGVIEGHVGNAAGALAFTVSVDGSGNVTLDQIRAVVHPNAANPDDTVTLSADNLVQLTATVTDKDGDHSSATLNIGQNLSFDDDGPSANNDSDTITSGGTVATGNVVTGVGTNEGAANADAPGADGFGSVTTIHSNGSGLTDTTFSAGVLSVHGTYGTLEIDANGNYTYTRDGGSPGNVSEQFTYTYVDKDGDPATATLTININDSAPALPDPGLVQLDDDALANGNAGGVGDDPNSAGTPGQLVGTGGDGALTYDFSGTNTLPSGFTTNLVDASHLQILQGATVVLTITLNNSTGVFSVVQNNPIDHPAGSNENNDIFGVGVQVKDADGDTDPATITINVDDDTPTVVLSGTSPSLTVDETVLATNDTKSFSGMFTDSFGADGPAAANSVAYTLGINAGATGLVDVATGQAIVLVVNAGVVEGHVGNAAGALAFTVSVDGSGNVTLDQLRALSHPDANNPNDSVSLANDNLVTLTQTITDHDGDQASATANIGQNLNFLDDGPSISLAAGAEPTLTVDETNLAANDTKSFAGSFSSSFGADGAGTVSYALSVTGGNGTASGLIDVATGSAIVLVNNGGVIEGHVATTGGALAFTVTVDGSGNVTLDQIRAVQHPDANNANDSVTLSADNLVVLTATVTDKDGDHSSVGLNIGQNLNFLDDGPSISATGAEPTLTVDETNLAVNDSKSFAANFNSSFGADGAGTVTYALSITGAAGTPSGLIDVATGSAIVLVNNAGVIEGHVGTTGGALAFTVTVNGSGSVTLDQIRAVSHPDASNPNDSVTLSADNLVVLTATVTDKDGDHQSASLNIGQNLNFLDDGPSISTTGAEPSLTVDETNLAANDSKSFAANFSSSFGADGAGTVTYQLGVTGGNGTASGLTDVATGQSIVLVNNAGVIEGHVGTTGGALAFTVTVDGSGNVTLDQIRAVSHPDASNPNDSVTLSADNLITLTATVTDKDGDHQSASLNIGQNLNFLDDGPSAHIATTGAGVSLDESVGIQADSNDTTNAGVIALFSGVANKGVDTDLPQYATNANAVVNSTGTTLGADGGTVSFSLNVSSAGVDSGLNTTDGQDIFLFKEGNLVVGRVGGAGGPAAFAIAIDNTGHVSTVEYLSIQHPNAANPDDSVSIANGAVLATVTATDGDGDSNAQSVAIGGAISFQDSAPVLTAVDNINIQNSGDVAATGGFHYLLGADGASTDNNVFAVTGSATVNGNAVTNWTMSETSENAANASYSFSFDYNTGSGGTAHETGTLVFDKAAGTYTVDLDNPIQGFSVLATAGAPASAFVNYNPDGSTSQGPSNIATVQLANNFFIQFTGDSAGSHTTVAPDGTFVPVTTASFAGIELFTGSAATVTVSSSAAGVAGNTIQGGEVLDFNLYSTDPHQNIGTPTQNATSMFIELDGVGATEDMIVVLKLYDTVTHQYTTEALMVQNGDIIKSNATLAGTAYSGIVLDNNDGLVVIEANDYQQGNSNLVIVGAQIAGSDSGVTGTAINLNGGLGASGGSSGTQAFSTDVNDNPFKIQNIGFLTNTTTNQNADLTFNVTIKDGDGDSLTQAIHATVTANADSATAIALGAGVTTVSQTAIAPKTAPTATNTNSVLMGAFAAAGLAASDSLAAATPHTDLHSSVSHMATAAYHSASLVPAAIEGLDGHRGVNMLVRDGGDGSAHVAAPSTTFHTDMVAAKGIAAAANTGHDPASSQLLHGTSAPVHAEPAASPVTAAAIAMPAASQLAAAHGGAVAGQHNGALGQILAEALHGGGNSSTIDHVLSSLPSHSGGGNPALEALASHNAAGVPMGDSHAFAGFSVGHAFSMEAAMVHVDAVQPHA